MRSIFICCFFVIAFLFGSMVAQACSCLDPGPPCQAYWNTPVVFSGRVLEVNDLKIGDSRSYYLKRQVRFAVNRSFRGTTEAAVELETGGSSADCGYNFKVGESYLVYSFQHNGKLTTGICTRTRPLTDASDDLDYINNLATAKNVAAVYGTVNKSAPHNPEKPYQPPVPLGSAILTIEGNDKRFETATDAQGKYHFPNLIPGDYILRLKTPVGLFAYQNESKVHVYDKGCAVSDFYLSPNTLLNGKILDENGAPASKIKVELIPIDQINERYQKGNHFAFTDESGRYEFRVIPPGKYYFGVRLGRSGNASFAYPRTFYPGTQNLNEAAMITISEGQTLEGYNLQLPEKLTSRKIEGIVLLPDGKPAPDTRMCFEEVEYAEESGCSSENVKVEKDGRFSAVRFNGFRYLIRAHANFPGADQRHAEPIEIPAHGDVKNIKLVVSEPRGNCQKCLRWTRNKND